MFDEAINHIAFAINTNGDHVKSCSFVFLLHLFHPRKRIAARWTPGRPEIEEDELGFEIAEFDAGVLSAQIERRRGFWCGRESGLAHHQHQYEQNTRATLKIYSISVHKNAMPTWLTVILLFPNSIFSVFTAKERRNRKSCSCETQRAMKPDHQVSRILTLSVDKSVYKS